MLKLLCPLMTAGTFAVKGKFYLNCGVIPISYMGAVLAIPIAI